MNRMLKIGEYGFLLWLIPFSVSLVIYPIKTFANPLFESIMSILLVIIIVLLTSTYFRGVNSNYLKEGAIIGIVWFLISIIIDLILFLPPSPMQMSFTNYIMDIGLTYVMIPIITIGMAYMADRSTTMS